MRFVKAENDFKSPLKNTVRMGVLIV